MSKAATVAAGALAIFATSAPVFAQAAAGTGKDFPDVPADHWAAQAVKLLGDRGIVIGYPDGTYGGPKAMTRYEFAEAISRLLPQIDQRIAEAIANMPQIPKLPGGFNPDNYYTKMEVDNLLNQKANSADVYTKAESDARFAAKSEIDRIMAMLNTFRDELTALGVDVNALKQRYAALDARVSQLEKLKVFGNGTVAFKVSSQGSSVGRGPAGFQAAGVDRDGALFDNGLSQIAGAAVNNVTGKRGIFSNPSALYDTQIGIQYAFDPKVRAVAQFIMGNYWGAWQEQQAFNAGFVGAGGATAGLLSNRQPGSLGLETYEAYLASAFESPVFPHAITQSGVAVGRIPTKLTRFTWWAVDPDTYLNIPREDSGNITLTGGSVAAIITGVGLNASIFGGYSPTDGTNPYTFQSLLDGSRAGTIGFGHYVRPGGTQTGVVNRPNMARTHLDANYFRIPTINSVAGVRIGVPWISGNYVIATGDDWRNPAFQNASFGGGITTPTFNRFGQVWSVDVNTTVPVSRLVPFVPTLGFSGEFARSSTNNYGAVGINQTLASGAHAASSGGMALDYKWTFPVGSTSWSLGGRSISPEFEGPGYWGQIGSWINPYNYVSDSFWNVNGGKGSRKFRIPVIPSDFTVGLPLTFLGSTVQDFGLSISGGVAHMFSDDGPGFPTQVSPNSVLAEITRPDNFKMAHASASLGATFEGYKFSVASEDVLRDYPVQRKGFGQEITFLWDALRNLVNVRGGSRKFGPPATSVSNITAAGLNVPVGTPAEVLPAGLVVPGGAVGTGALNPTGTLPLGVQSDENYYQFSVGKSLTADGSALAKLLFQRVVYNDRTGNSGGSYRGNVGAVQVTYKF